MLQKAFQLLEEAFQVTTEFYAKTIPRKPVKSLLHKPGVIAHRGLIAHPTIKENTMLAFEECLKKNIWGIEFDIRWTKDLYPIIHHDPSTLRVWGKDKFIHEMNLTELKNEFPAIPSLSEVAASYGNKMHLMIEIKKLPEFTDSEMKTASYNLTDALQSLQPEQHYHFMSFQPEELIKKFKLNPKSILGIATTNIKDAINTAEKWKIKGITGHFALITSKLRILAQAKNLKVGVGFINSKNSMYRELELNADFLYSNNPLVIQGLLNKIPAPDAQQQ